MLALLLVPYSVGLLIFLIISAFAVFRLIRFGSQTAGSWATLIIFISGTVIALALTVWLLPTINWQGVASPLPTNNLFS